jgi:hypothetical protein
MMMMMMVFGRRREEKKAKRSTLKEVLDLLGSSEVDGLLALVVLDLGVSSMGQQDLDDLNVSLLTGHHQGSLASSFWRLRSHPRPTRRSTTGA